MSHDVERELERQKQEADRIESLDSRFYQVGDTFELTGHDFSDDRYSASYLSRVGWTGTMKWAVVQAVRFDSADDLGIPEEESSSMRDQYPKGYFVQIDVDIENIDASDEMPGSNIGEGWIRPHLGLVPIEDGSPRWREGSTGLSTCLFHDAVPQGSSEKQGLYMELPRGSSRRVRLVFAITPNDANESFSQSEFEGQRFGLSIGRAIGETCNGSCVIDLGDMQ